MRIILMVILSLFCSMQHVPAQTKLRGQPATLPETFAYLDKIFADDTTRYGFMTMPEFYLPLHYDMSLGVFMRNNWGLEGNSKLKRWFVSCGVNDASQMSGIILTSFHRYLNHEPIDLEQQLRSLKIEQPVAKRVDSLHYIYDFKEAPSQVSLLKKFPVGQTIMLYTAAETQGRSNGNTSLRAFAVVRAHNGDALLFEITHIEERPDAKAARQIGEMVEGYPSEVYQLPPPGWKWH